MTSERAFTFSQFKSVDSSTLGISNGRQPSQLDHSIAPEVKDDALYHHIMKLAREEKIRSILEIGSSSGGGSTEAFVMGARENPHKPTLMCMEVSAPRFNELQKRYSKEGFVKCYNVSSVPPNEFPSESQVADFYNSTRTALNQYPLEQVLGWLRQDLSYIKDSPVPTNGIFLIKQENSIKDFDLVFIDGSEFTGEAEFNYINGAKIIILDDVNSFKNYTNRRNLMADPNYVLIEENLNLRNGYSIFKKVTTASPIEPISITGARNILWLQNSNISEAILATNSLRALSESCPMAKLHVFCSDELVDLYMASPVVATVTGFCNEQILSSESYREEIGKRVRDLGADVCLNSNIQTDPVTDYLVSISGAGVRVGWSSSATTPTANIIKDSHKIYSIMIDRVNTDAQRQLNQFLIKLGVTPVSTSPQVWLAPSDEDWAANFFKQNNLTSRDTITLSIGRDFSALGGTKIGQSIFHLCSKERMQIVAIGESNNKEFNGSILSSLTGIKALNLSGELNLRHAAALIKKSRLVVTTDLDVVVMCCAFRIPHVLLIEDNRIDEISFWSPLTTTMLMQTNNVNAKSFSEINSKVFSFALDKSLAKIDGSPRIVIDGTGNLQLSPIIEEKLSKMTEVEIIIVKDRRL